MNRYEAHIEKNWQEHGLAHVLVMRQHEENSTDMGVFLVDTWCLGVKDAYGECDLTAAAIEELLEERLPEVNRERIHPACAKKLIAGAIAYAEKLGFAPHRDFRKARRVLSGIDETLCPTEFTFGRDGKPCFVQGPDDTTERVDRVLSMLEARCGEDGFDFEIAEEEDEVDLVELREDLMAWLDAEPDDVPRFYRFSGLVTAMQVCPEVILPTKLLEVLWGPAGREWADQAQLQDFTWMLMEYWNYVGGLVGDNIAPDAPLEDQAIDVWAEDFPEKNRSIATLAAMIDWAGGFMEATQFWPAAWGDALARPNLAEHWEIVRWWAEFIGTGNKDRIAAAAAAQPPRNIARSIQALARALRPPPPGQF